MNQYAKFLKPSPKEIPDKTLLKPKRKLGIIKGVCHSFKERTEDHDEFLMPNLDDDNLSISSSSVSKNRGIKLNLNSASNSSKRSSPTETLKVIEEIKQMKESLKNKSGFCSKPTSKTLSYLFVSDIKPKSDKEKNITEYLNNKGVFQIHLCEALKAFKLPIEN